LETDPLSMIVHFALANTHYWMHDFAGAKRIAANGLEIDPGFWLARLALALAEFQLGELDEAIRNAVQVLESAPFYSIAGGFLAAAQVRAGRREEAEAVMARFRNARHYVLPTCFAIYHACNGDADAMFAAYDEIIRDHDPYGRPLTLDPVMDPYRDDPRFYDVLRRMNLHWSARSNSGTA